VFPSIFRAQSVSQAWILHDLCCQHAARAVSVHSIFLTYGTKCIPDSWHEKMRQCAPPGRAMNLIQAYKAQLPAPLLEQFRSDVVRIMDEVNADPDRVSGESTRLVQLLKERDAGAKVRYHPAFKALPVRLQLHPAAFTLHVPSKASQWRSFMQHLWRYQRCPSCISCACHPSRKNDQQYGVCARSFQTADRVGQAPLCAFLGLLVTKPLMLSATALHCFVSYVAFHCSQGLCYCIAIYTALGGLTSAA
jgi:hypothetical protein